MATTIALLVGISDAYLWSSQWVLSDPLFIAFTLLCLWALHRAQTGVRAGGALWLAVGWSAAVLAYFTRSAGLPLLLAVAAWVALKRRWRTLAVMVVSFGIPAALWWYRGAGLGAAYISEFWFVDPYRPDLGRADAMDLVSRVYGNARMYLGTYIPGGLTGLRGTPIKILGGGLGALALVGWLRRAKAGITPAELFAPLYLGLVLLWPEVWSGDRFALPLYPFFLFYAGEALIHFVRPARPAARVAAGAAAFALVLVPAGGVWWGVSARSSACRELVQQAGPFACYGDPVLEFERAAVWSGHHLPPGSSVLTRKPRLFFVLNGIQGQAYPLTRDPEEFLDFAGRTSSSYLVLDRFDNLAAYLSGAGHRRAAGPVLRDYRLGCRRRDPNRAPGDFQPRGHPERESGGRRSHRYRRSAGLSARRRSRGHRRERTLLLVDHRPPARRPGSIKEREGHAESDVLQERPLDRVATPDEGGDQWSTGGRERPEHPREPAPRRGHVASSGVHRAPGQAASRQESSKAPQGQPVADAYEHLLDEVLRTRRREGHVSPNERADRAGEHGRTGTGQRCPQCESSGGARSDGAAPQGSRDHRAGARQESRFEMTQERDVFSKAAVEASVPGTMFRFELGDARGSRRKARTLPCVAETIPDAMAVWTHARVDLRFGATIDKGGSRDRTLTRSRMHRSAQRLGS